MKMEPSEILKTVSIKCNDNWEAMYYWIVTKKDMTPELIEECRPYFDDIITIVDDEYPQEFKETGFIPITFHYEGDLSILKNHKFVYLIGENTFGIEPEKIVFTDKENVVHFGTKLKIWCDKTDSVVATLGVKMSKSVVITKVLNAKEYKELIKRDEKAKIYVVPTIEKSFNNKLIKEKKAKLIDTIDDIK